MQFLDVSIYVQFETECIATNYRGKFNNVIRCKRY